MKTRTTPSLLRQAFAMLPILMLLSACGDGKSLLGAAEEKIEFANDNTVNQTIDRSRPYELVISGSGNSIIIASDNRITQLTISGSNNVVTVSSGTTIDTLTFTGNDNTVTKLSGSIITTVVDQTGSNNIISA